MPWQPAGPSIPSHLRYLSWLCQPKTLWCRLRQISSPQVPPTSWAVRFASPISFIAGTGYCHLPDGGHEPPAILDMIKIWWLFLSRLLDDTAEIQPLSALQLLFLRSDARIPYTRGAKTDYKLSLIHFRGNIGSDFSPVASPALGDGKVDTNGAGSIWSFELLENRARSCLWSFMNYLQDWDPNWLAVFFVRDSVRHTDLVCLLRYLRM